VIDWLYLVGNMQNLFVKYKNSIYIFISIKYKN
jgi:hypothetical protein